MHSPFVPGRSQRLTWWWADLRSARFSLGLAGLLLLVEAGIQSAGGLAVTSAPFEWLGLSRDGILKGRFWQLGSHALLHGGWIHALTNAVMLAIAGARIERIGGRAMVAKVFCAGAISGGGAFLLLPSPDPGMILVGASGGVFALILWLTTVSPQSRMWPVPLSARNLGLGLLLASGGMAIMGRWLPSGPLPIAHGCHFGGALAGWVMARRLMKTPVDLARLRKERARRESAGGP